jgi:serine protease AprX
MEIDRDWLEDLIFGEPPGAATGVETSSGGEEDDAAEDEDYDGTLLTSREGPRRFTQDSPVLPDVWIEFALRYCRKEDATLQLLLTPHRDVTTAKLAVAVRERLEEERKTPVWRKRHPGPARSAAIAPNQAAVAVRLYLDELLRVLLPLTSWWADRVQPHIDEWKEPERPRTRKQVHEGIKRVAKGQRVGSGWSADLLWMIRVVGVILLAREAEDDGDMATRRKRFEALVEDEKGQTDAVLAVVQPWPPKYKGKPPLWLVSRNRAARTTVWRSSLAVKADAARRLFNISCSKLAWAVIDSGIDARHPAFKARDLAPLPRGKKRTWAEESRVVETYDFTRVRELLDPDRVEKVAEEMDDEDAVGDAKELRRALKKGRTVDWGLMVSLLRVKHDDSYKQLEHAHGTHVAGILAGDWRRKDDPAAPWRKDEEDLVGVCPDLRLYDLRVLDKRGRGSEFTVMAALQFIRFLNSQREQPVIHGANLSMSILHDVANYACGRTPVCEECERVVASGVVVVAAAGNDGHMQYATPRGSVPGYRSISISDPGNAEEVITVGATHRYQPHTYGVSYFSSRGPTGDGRIKPDLVAPGEKIKSPVPGGASDTKDGTSMAAPHVSGAAALLIARHRELLGRPRQIKKILCDTATDLGRERYFQGSGMVDVLRALQAV